MALLSAGLELRCRGFDIHLSAGSVPALPPAAIDANYSSAVANYQLVRLCRLSPLLLRSRRDVPAERLYKALRGLFKKRIPNPDLL